MREQRLAVEEKSALLAKVIAALDIAVLAFDAQGFLKLANPAAERLLGGPFAELNGRSAQALGLGDWLSLGDPHISERNFPGGSGRWEVRRASFREDGRPHDLLVITDLSRTLREEERLAWQRLLRVLGHELNNSLAPIRSMAATLAKLLAAEPLAEDWREDAGSALGVIGDRAEALARFMARYTAFARLPPPKPRRFAFAELAQRVAHLEQRLSVEVEQGPDIEISADPDQIEQALINLLKNAVDASLAVPVTSACAGVHEGRFPVHRDHRFRNRLAAQRKPVRAVLHDQARWLRHRPGARATDRRSPRWFADPRKPRRCRRLRRAREAACMTRRAGRGSRHLPVPRGAQAQ